MCFLKGTNWVLISPKTVFFIVAAVKTANLTRFIKGSSEIRNRHCYHTVIVSGSSSTGGQGYLHDVHTKFNEDYFFPQKLDEEENRAAFLPLGRKIDQMLCNFCWNHLLCQIR
jgi:hypothetical protein